MVDLATLGLAVDSRQVRQATDDLNKFAKTATDAERAAAKTVEAVAKGKPGATAFAQGFAQADAAQKSYTASANRVIDNLSDQFVRLNSTERQWRIFQNTQRAGVSLNSEVGQNIAKMTGALYDMEQAQNRTTSSADRFASTLSRRVIGAILVTQIKDVIKEIYNLNASLASIGDVSRRIGTSTGTFQQLESIAGGRGISSDDFAAGAMALAKNINEGVRSGNELQQLFQANGLSLRNNTGLARQWVDILADGADLVARAKNEQDKFVVVQKLGLPPTEQWVKLLEQGGAALRQRMEEARAAGVETSDELIRKAQEFDEAWNRAYSNFSKQARAATAEAMDGFTGLIDRYEQFARKVGSSDFWKIFLPENHKEIAAGMGLTPVDPFASASANSRVSGGFEALNQQREIQTKITDQIQQQLRGLNEQLEVAQAITGADQIRVEAQQTYNELIRRGVDAKEAANVAAAQEAVAFARVESSAQRTLSSMQDQYAVASAVTGAEKIRAQAQATYNQLVQQGVSSGTASTIAAQQQANAFAAVNAQAQGTLLSLRDQFAVASAVTGAERIRAQAQATFNRLVREGVDAQTAMAVAVQEQNNAYAQVNAQVEEQIHQLYQQIELIDARNRGIEASVRGEQAYVNALRAGASEETASRLRDATEALAEAQKVRKQYESQIALPVSQFSGDPTQLANSYLSQGVAAAFQAVLRQGVTETNSSVLQQLIDLTPDAQKPSLIQQQLGSLYQQPATIARDTLIKQLTDQLAQLTSSTDSLNATMQSILSPLYTTDPRQTHLGFRTFADGGVMTAYGPVPLRKYDGGGIATSPQLALFGEGSGPEAFVPLENGAIPVRMQGGQPVTVQIDNRVIIQGNADPATINQVGRTQFQNAQRMRAMLGA